MPENNRNQQINEFFRNKTDPEKKTFKESINNKQNVFLPEMKPALGKKSQTEF